MGDLVQEAIEAGAWGMTSGLLYAPSCYGQEGEFVFLSRIVASYGGYYGTHMRNESDLLLSSRKY